ncbi:TOBE domain-containing protein [Stomatohabitans albus]|uniref:TOBE domain-containing protein n=1 Tax=Stomatohabitans albus TaxID=3110766 RepID=UPI00300C4DFA
MIDLHVVSTEPPLSIQAHCSRAYIHAVLADPQEPISPIFDQIVDEAYPNAHALREDGQAATISYIRRSPRLINPLTIADNVMMAYLARGLSHDEATVSTHTLLSELHIDDLADRYPDELTIEQQRLIAAERDLDPSAELVIVDDVMCGITRDAGKSLRAWLRHLPDRVGGVVLVHSGDPLWAMSIADRFLLIDQGRVAQHDTMHGVLRQPINGWAADVLTNVYRGSLQNGVVTLADGRRVNTHVSGTATNVVATVHPRSVTLHRERPEGSASNVWHGRVAGLEPSGDRIRVNMLGLTPLVAEVTVGSSRRLDLPVGGPIWASFKASRVDVYAMDT